MPVLLLERGKAVPERLSDVRAFWERGVLNPESHVHFGEGGAGTFSDGKLTTRVKNPYTAWVKRVLADMGAPAEILADARPHIGTDRLREVVVNLRQRLIGMGCEIRFGAHVTDFLIRRAETGRDRRERFGRDPDGPSHPRDRAVRRRHLPETGGAGGRPGAQTLCHRSPRRTSPGDHQPDPVRAVGRPSGPAPRGLFPHGEDRGARTAPSIPSACVPAGR